MSTADVPAAPVPPLIPIDPTLLSTPTPIKSGAKRKARTSVSSVATTTPGGRVTRRSAALSNNQANGHDATLGIGSGAGGGSKGNGEPTRGEEENLIEYPWRGNKRSRRESPTKRLAKTASLYPFGPVQIDIDAGPSTGAPAGPVVPSQGHADLAGVPISGKVGSPIRSGGDDGAPLKMPHKHLPLPPLPYPYGLTPYRYTCLHPDLPPPPPAGPSNPKLKPFNPTYSPPSKTAPRHDTSAPQPGAAHPGTQQALQPSQRPLPRASSSAPGPSSISSEMLDQANSAFYLPHLAQMYSQAQSSQAGDQLTSAAGSYSAAAADPALDPSADSTLSAFDQLHTLFGDDPAFSSFSALLSASQNPFSIDPSAGGYPASPGERSDGRAGPLSPKLAGRYLIGAKVDCESCREGRAGHWGHWLRSGAGE